MPISYNVEFYLSSNLFLLCCIALVLYISIPCETNSDRCKIMIDLISFVFKKNDYSVLFKLSMHLATGPLIG